MRTKEVAAEEYCKKAGYQLNIASDMVGIAVYTSGFKAGIDFAQKWISIDDDLPIENLTVLVKVEDYDPSTDYPFITSMFILNGYWQDITTGTKTSGIVTHWRPIEIK